jgi:WD40 repeat protein
LAAAVSRDGTLLVTASGNRRRPLDPGGVALWDAATGAKVAGLVIPQGPRSVAIQAATGGAFAAAPTYHTGPVSAAALTPDGRTLVTATRRTDRDGMTGQDVAAYRRLGGEVLVWDVPSRRVRAAFPGAAAPIAVSADGTRVAACCEGRVARVWDVAGGVFTERPPLPPHPGGVSALALSPDGTRLAVAGVVVESLAAGDARTRFAFGVYDAATGRKLPASPVCDVGVQCLAFSPDGAALAAGCLDGVVRQWDAASGRPVASLRGHANAVAAVAFAPDGKTVATGGTDQAVKVWDAADGRELRTYRGHDRPVTDVAFCPAGPARGRLVSAGADGVVRGWPAPGPADHVELVGHDGNPNDVAFSPDLPVVATVCRKEAKVRLWDPETGRPLGDPLPARAERVAFGPRGLLATTGGDAFDRPGELLLWDVTTRTVKHRLVGHKLFVTAVAFSPDGRWLASAGGHVLTGEPNSVRVWDAVTGAEVRAFQPPVGVAAALAFSPDGHSLAVGGLGDAVAVCDPATGLDRFVVRHPVWVRAVAYSPDGGTIAVGDFGGFLTLRAAADGREVRRFRAHAAMVTAVAYHPRGRRLASASFDPFDRGTGEVKVWDTADGREMLDLPGELAVAFSADGRRLAAPARGGVLGAAPVVRVWDGGPYPLVASLRGEGTPVFAAVGDPSGRVVATSGPSRDVLLWDNGRVPRPPPRVLAGHAGPVSGLDLSPDGRLLASGSEDATVRVWEVESGKSVATLRGHTARVARVRFDPTGGRLVSTGDDRTARVWDVATGRELLKVDHPEGIIVDLALSPNGRAAVCGGKCVRVFEIATGRTVRTIGTPHNAVSVAWGHGLLAAGESEGFVRVWDAETGEPRGGWKAHDGRAWGLAFTRGGVLVSGGSDRLARAWDPATGARLAEYPGHLDVVRRVEPTGAGFATAGFDGTVRFWVAPERRP